MEISWSPPSSAGTDNITGYRVFYDGQSIFFLPPTVSGIHLDLGESIKIGQTVSVRTESATSLLPSDLIMANILGKTLSLLSCLYNYRCHNSTL